MGPAKLTGEIQCEIDFDFQNHQRPFYFCDKMKKRRLFLEFDYLSRNWSTFGNGFTGRVLMNIWHLSFTQGLF